MFSCKNYIYKNCISCFVTVIFICDKVSDTEVWQKMWVSLYPILMFNCVATFLQCLFLDTILKF